MKFYKRFPGDIQIKTGHLSPAEFGCYDRLLDHYYATEAPLPRERERCYSIARTRTAADCRACDAALDGFFTLTEGGWVQSRAEEVIAEAQPRIAAARTNGRGGGRPKKNPSATEQKPSGFSKETENGTKTVTQDADFAKASKSQIPDSASQNPPTPRRKRVAFDPREIELPDWLDRDLWHRWCKDRADRRKPITEEGAKGQIVRLGRLRDEGHTPQAVIEHAISSGYQGLFAPPKDAPSVVAHSHDAEHSRQLLAKMEADRKASQTPEAKAAAAKVRDLIANGVVRRAA